MLFSCSSFLSASISFVFELGFYGIDEDQRRKLDALANTRNPRNKKPGEKYKRIETFGWKLFGEDDENNKALIKKEIQRVLQEEPKWIEEAKKEMTSNLAE